MKFHVIHAGTLKLDGGAMFGVVPKSIWSKAYPSDENNQITLAMRCLLVEYGSRRILIDTGMGDKQDDRFFGHYRPDRAQTLAGSLARHGFTAADITDVLLTHLHFDHCGGAVSRNVESNTLVPTFPLASYHVSQGQWDWAMHPNRREKASFLHENIMPLHESGQLHLFAGPFSLFPGFDIKLFNGHTQGQAIPYINNGQRTLVYLADTIPTAAHVPLPYVMAYDTRPLITLQEKEEMLEQAVSGQHILFFEHDEYHECALLEKTDKGIKVSGLFALNELV